MEEFVSHPTRATQTIVDDISKCETDYYKNIPSSGLKKIAYGFKKEIEFKTAYKELFTEINEAEEKWDETIRSLTSLDDLYTAFLSFYKSVIRINSLIVHAHVKLHQKVPRNEYLTKEDEKNLLLQKITANKKNLDEFKQSFGHYSQNPFELSSRRFREYKKNELQALATLFATFTVTKTKTLAQEIKKTITGDKDLFMLYVTLREAYKYHAIRYIDAMHELIKNSHSDKTIYDQPFYQLMEALQ